MTLGVAAAIGLGTVIALACARAPTPDEVAAEIRSLEDRLIQLRAAKIRLAQISLGQHGAAEGSSLEIGAAAAGMRKVGRHEDRVR